MAPAATLLANLMNAGSGAPTPKQLRMLQTAATLDGRVDAQERRVLKVMPGMKDWLQRPTNPEVAFVRANTPAFDARVKALTQHAKPGDLIFWQDTSGSRLSTFLGEFPHVSLVLPGGKLLDTMSIEGASISTPEAVVAKTARRLKAGEIAIARPKTPLTAGQISKLGKLAEQLQGREYALLSPMKDEAAAVSCSRSVYEVLKGAGVDLAPEQERLVRNAVMPGDLIKGVDTLGRIGTDGVFRAGEKLPMWKPSSWVKAVGHAWDFVMTHFPGLWEFAGKIQASMTKRLRAG
ncbi:MAG: hypothetical protein JWM80_375 [Cyanobacteria bacterium RYN_339]|nr:hypothetical protein [Cyanobacteria bacterium RYN_339]